VALRFDAFQITKFERTASGALKIDGVLSRAGVFTYHGPAGAVREYRPAAVVTRADTLASFEDVPLTRDHPRGMVTPDTYASVVVGHIRGVRAEGDKVVGTVVVARKDVIDDVESKTLRELSPGYGVELEDKPGRTDAGENYDRITTRMVINHVAILPPGKSRQGIGLRLDAEDNEVLDPNCTMPIRTHIGTADMKIKIRFDGKDHEVEVGSPEHIELVKKCDARDAENAALKLELEKTKAANEALNTELAKARKDAEDAPAKAAEALTKRTATETAARKVLGPETKFDGKKDREIHEAVCKSRAANFKGEGRSDEAVAAMFEVYTSAADTSRQDSIAGLGTGAPVTGTKSADREDADESKIEKTTAEAWKKPMPYSRA
jgi:uncharacterized protein